MQTIRSYLVVIEPQLMESLALKRAKEIASITQAHLHLLISDKEHDHTALLDVLTGTLKNEGYSVTSRRPGTKTCTPPSSRNNKSKDVGW